MCHLLSIGEREDLRLSARIDERSSIVGREAVWHDMNGGLFGRGASPIDASVGGPIVRARVQVVDGAQDEASGSPVSDLVVDWFAVGTNRIADSVPFGLVGELALFTRPATSQAFMPGLLVDVTPHADTPQGRSVGE
jgi:hypothetical protein